MCGILSIDNNYVIGVIEIEKINIKYPIFYGYSKDLLEIGTCRIFGPFPDSIGNLCIISHNYNDERFFSRLNKLEINDVIKIYDNLGNKYMYYVYDKYEISSSDISVLSQNTNGNFELTLITCTNTNFNNRLVIKEKK